MLIHLKEKHSYNVIASLVNDFCKQLDVTHIPSQGIIFYINQSVWVR